MFDDAEVDIKTCAIWKKTFLKPKVIFLALSV